jgi:hypothetical protein
MVLVVVLDLVVIEDLLSDFHMQLAARPPAPPLYRYLFAGTGLFGGKELRVGRKERFGKGRRCKAG